MAADPFNYPKGPSQFIRTLDYSDYRSRVRVAGVKLAIVQLLVELHEDEELETQETMLAVSEVCNTLALKVWGRGNDR